MACGLAALVLIALALLVLVSKFMVVLGDPFSFAALVIAATVAGAVACGREARRSLA
ncbi:hypothetical protein [Aquihabitans sp. McL0605]|uniref:hypothetical protein n=1 Tax=Aquihabitans sp. McL0605 TaxID=3415671 RepID=UPI003CF8EA9A